MEEKNSFLVKLLKEELFDYGGGDFILHLEGGAEF